MKGKKALAITLIASLLSVSSLVYAKDPIEIKTNSGNEPKICELREIRGNVLNSHFGDNDGKYILVGDKYPTSVFVVTNDTKIVNTKGEELSFYDLKNGMRITGYHNGISMKCLPPHYVVNTVIVDSEEMGSLVTEGIITRINSLKNEGSKMLWVKGRKETRDALTEINLIVDKSTEILNNHGEKLKLEDIKENTIVEGVYGRAVTRSYPAQGVAKKVIVREDKAVTKGKISSISIGEEWSRLLVGDEYLIVSSKTTIEDVHGKKIELKDIKEGMNIVSFGSVVVALSYPCQRGSYNIIIMD